MHRLILALLIALAAAAPAHAAKKWTAGQIADLDRISAYLNSIRTMRGGFTQIGPQGQMDQGKFYILKPGKIRFDYNPPNPTLVIGDGVGIAVYNTKLNTANRYPLNGTPLNLLLSDHLDLKRSANVLDVQHSPGEIILKARANDRRTTGNITIVFTDPGLELRQWTIVDAQGLPTTVSINNVQQGVDLPESAFKINRQ
jgi:outer membrane lipoprotein-sorting protein